VETPTISVETRWPGASPQEVEQEIVQEQEEQLKNVEGVTKMSSEAMDSRAEINLEFDVGTDMAEALVNVNTRLQQVREYPVNADEPVVSTQNLSNQPIAWFVLTPRVPTTEEIDAFLARYPQHTDLVRPVREAHNSGLKLYRLRKLAESHADIKELADIMPPAIDVPRLRKFAEDTIEAAFERVPGVAAATVIGGRHEQMEVVLDPQ
jgi:HAE1 family hydrophobic/amphiphilic exporter-1